MANSVDPEQTPHYAASDSTIFYISCSSSREEYADNFFFLISPQKYNKALVMSEQHTFSWRNKNSNILVEKKKKKTSRKHTYIILTPLNPTYMYIYIVKLGFTGV